MTNLFKDFHKLCDSESQPQAQDFVLKAENAALKEQVAQWETEYNGCSSLLNNAERTLETLEETIAQQAEVIEQMRDVFKAASMDTETINRKAPEIAKDCCSMPMPDTYGMYHLTDEEVCNVVRYYLYWLHKNQPINLQPSPEILQARDEQIVAVIASYVRCADYDNDPYILANKLTEGEWRKCL